MSEESPGYGTPAPQPEPPDFASLARRILIEAEGIAPETTIAEQLRLLWNARGAADIATIETEIAATLGSVVKQLARTIRALDR